MEDEVSDAGVAAWNPDAVQFQVSSICSGTSGLLMSILHKLLLNYQGEDALKWSTSTIT